MHNYAAWVLKLADRTMMAGLYKAEKVLKAIDDEEATSDEIEDLSHALEVICKSEKLMDHMNEHHMHDHNEASTTDAAASTAGVNAVKARVM